MSTKGNYEAPLSWQNKFKYKTIIELGFTEQIIDDKIYFNQHGFDYSIVQLNLTKRIYLDWTKETKLCKLVRVDSPKNGIIKAEMPIKDIKHLKEIINFFKDQ